MSKTHSLILLSIFSFFFFACTFHSPSTQSETEIDIEQKENPKQTPTISSEYWGTWIQMDTGKEYYINNNCIYENRYGSNYKIQEGIAGYSLENEYILKKNNIRFFKKGGIPRDFSIQISGFADQTSRAVASTNNNKKKKFK